jgi:hypothetical protein
MKWSLPKIALLVVMVAILAGVAVGVTLILINSSNAVEFPQEFKFGAASASYQIEGGWDEDGKSPNIWDTVTKVPGYIFDNSSGDVAADSYHMVDKDVDALVDIGVSRFSIIQNPFKVRFFESTFIPRIPKTEFFIASNNLYCSLKCTDFLYRGLESSPMAQRPT